MTRPQRLIFLILLITLISWFAWFLVIFKINPYESKIAPLLFYTSLFFALWGSFFLLSYQIKKSFFQIELKLNLSSSFRQGIFLGLLLIILLFLRSKLLLKWWNSLLFILGFILIEIFFLSYKKDEDKEEML